jgi:hypothetical protein
MQSSPFCRVGDRERVSLCWKGQSESLEQMGSIENVSTGDIVVKVEFWVPISTEVVLSHGKREVNGIVSRCSISTSGYFIHIQI